MPSVWIQERKLSSGRTSYRVRYRTGGRESAISYGGAFKNRRTAQMRCDWVACELAAGRDVPPSAKRHGACVITYQSVTKGVVYRVKYRDPLGRQIKETLGSTRDGWTIEAAQEALETILSGQQDNPVAPLLRSCDTLISRQKQKYGDCVPHLLVAREQIAELFYIAQSELARHPEAFSEAE